MNMKVSLNLLPEENKAVLSRKCLDRFLLWQALLVFSTVAFYVVVLWSVYYIVHDNRTFVESTEIQSTGTNSESKEIAEYESRFRNANVLSKQASRFLDSHPNWTEFLLRMDRLVPPNVSLSALVTRESRVSLSGSAKTRDDFLLFESALKEDACFSNFLVPISNLFMEKNVEFQIDFSVRESCLIGDGTL
jgi:Tfp pilus assembly protein PilN